MRHAITQLELPGLHRIKQGKVRDIFDLPEGLLIVASDRLSAFDVVFREGIPGKGAVLNTLSAFWFGHLGAVFPNHYLTAKVHRMPEAVQRHAEVLRGRCMLVRKARVLPVECIARGYLAGSGYKEYQRTGTVCGIPLPAGLRLSSRLPEPVFTPSTKAETGHDENITFDRAVEILGADLAGQVREATLALYAEGAKFLARRGIILCDTKFEFGVTDDGTLLLIDEALTPDSSRFWDQSAWREGVAQDSFDKQVVRDYLLSTSWDQNPPPPPLPAEVVEKTSARYREIAERIVGREIMEAVL